MRDFNTLIAEKWSEKKFLCVGLDPDLDKIPARFVSGPVEETLVRFNTYIIDEVGEYQCAYKPNSAFYERYGDAGMRALKNTIEYVHSTQPEIPVILDAKRADIGNTNLGYVSYAFEYLKADAITVHPYMGGESLKEFFDCENKGIFVMCRNSNPGAGEFQDLSIDGSPLYMHLAEAFRDKWNYHGNCGLVVGATFPEEIKNIREAVPVMPFLIPGTGAQGGDLEKSVAYGKNRDGKGFILSTSRAIIYAESPRAKAAEYHSAIQKAL
jgi:orotidine-5'-phosphate decarboxylase